MFKKLYQYCFIFIMVALSFCCVKPFNPPVFQSGNNYLVIDGFINTSPGAVTTITLTRSRNLNDSVTVSQPELAASVSIKSDGGNIYSLASQGDGNYKTGILNLDNTKSYQLLITTSNGEQYSSDFVQSKQAPPIDSMSWEQSGDVFIYLYTHDPANNTHYYKWDFGETWQYNSREPSYWVAIDTMIYYADTTNQVDSCWKTGASKDIIIGSSTSLSEDVISHQPIAIIPQHDERIGVRYSMLARQIGISAEAYKYWQIVQENSKNRGGLFDLQPGQLVGNIHSLSNPNEPVIGFISVATPTTYRLFISNRDLTDWNLFENECLPKKSIPQDPRNFQHYYYTDPAYTIWYFSGSDIVLGDKDCIDCRLHGGVNKRPPFW